MSDDRKGLWINVFQENQRQIIEAHDAYQRALADGHAAFLKAMGESQAILARAIQGDEPVEGWPEPPVMSPMTANPSAVALRSVPLTIGVVDAPRPGDPWSGLFNGARIGVIPDAFGIGARLVDGLCKRGWDASLFDPAKSFTSLIFLGALLEDQRAVGRGAGLRAAMQAAEAQAEHMIFVGDLGGRFGLDALEPFRAMHIALLHVAHSHGARFIDLDVGFRRPEDVAQDLLVELHSGGDETPIGLPEDGRVCLVEEPSTLHVGAPARAATQTCLMVTDVPGRAQQVRDAWAGRLAVVGCHLETAEFSRTVQLAEPMDIYGAISEAQLRLGPVHVLLFAWGAGEGTFADKACNISTCIHTTVAATAADPLVRITSWNQSDDDVAGVVAWTLMAEQQRREGEATVAAVKSDTFDPTIQLFGEGPVMWSDR